nr:M3 family metallopeptidase [Gammaproteobacteria bacterium]
MINPLLNFPLLPPFTKLRPEQAKGAITQLIAQCHDQLKQGLKQPGWETTLEPLEEAQDQLNRAFSLVSHLNYVLSGSWREPYEATLALVTDYWTKLEQNPELFALYKAMVKAPEFNRWPQARKQLIRHALRDMYLGGVSLEESARARCAAINRRLAELSSKFANNLLDATNAWTLHIEDFTELAGVPQTVIANAKATATERDLNGWLLTLEEPCFLAIMTHAENRQLRQQIQSAFVSRASEIGPHADKFDNAPIMAETLALRAEKAHLLGMKNYAQLSLASKMAEDSEQVLNFLQDLVERVKPAAEREIAELKTLATTELGLDNLYPWDIAWAAEKLKQQNYAVSQEALRVYFPFPQVLQGLFTVVEKLFGITAKVDDSVATWHPDVLFFWLLRDGKPIAGFYLDPYAREHKHSGAWMDSVCVRRNTERGLQLPVAYLVCNFSPPSDTAPALLTHDEVITLFHEFGHGLHHMLTKVDIAVVSGINGVACDAVELPSQFLENWCWQPQVISMISAHYQTGEPLPQTLLDKMLTARNFQSALCTLRQLELALFDLRLHCRPEGANAEEIQTLLNEVRSEVAVVSVSPENRFQNSFGHIFESDYRGGYEAGYYSYMWAEVLSADAFSLFEQHGVFHRPSAEKFLHTILEQGGSCDMQELFV